MKFIKKSQIEKDIKELPNGILRLLLRAARSINIQEIAIVGGVVRDLISKSKNKDYNIIFNDLDIVIEGDVQKFIEKIKAILGSERIDVIRNNISYKTSEITIDGIKVDIAEAREETYPIPAKNPIVKSSNIEKDLFRRDFSINAMAINLNNDRLIDLFSGLDAISKRKIEFLHELSVLEDPTRIIRASRYSAKLDFKLSNKSLKQIEDTIKSWQWNWDIHDKPSLAPEALSIRLRMELELLFKSNKWENALNNLKDWGALKIIDSKLQNDPNLCKKIKIAKKSKIAPLTAFIYESRNPLELSERLNIDSQQLEIIRGAILISNHLKKIKSSKEYKNWKPSKWTIFLESLNANEDSFMLIICKKNTFNKYLLCWHNKWRRLKSPINGKDLIAQGWESGPEIGIEIKRKRMELIDAQKYDY